MPKDRDCVCSPRWGRKVIPPLCRKDGKDLGGMDDSLQLYDCGSHSSLVCQHQGFEFDMRQPQAADTGDGGTGYYGPDLLWAGVSGQAAIGLN